MSLSTKLTTLISSIRINTTFPGEPEQTSSGRRSSLRWSYATPKFNKTPEEMLAELPDVYPTLVNCATFAKLGYRPLKNGETVTWDLEPYLASLSSRLVTSLDVLEVFTLDGVTMFIGKNDSLKSIIVGFKAKLDLADQPVDYTPLSKKNAMSGIKVLSSFQTALTSLESTYQIVDAVKSTLERFPSFKLFIVGHSIGGSLAALFGFEAQAMGWNPSVITFGSPKLGYDSTPTAYLKKLVTLFGITSDVIDKADMNRHLSDSSKSFFINVESMGDVMPKLPLGKYQKLGGVPFTLKTVDPNYPQFLYTQDVDYRLNSRSALRAGLRFNKGLRKSAVSLDERLLDLLDGETYDVVDLIKAGDNNLYFVEMAASKGKL